MPATLDDLGDRWASLGYQEPEDRMASWLRPIVVVTVLIIGLVAGELLMIVVPLVFAVSAVVALIVGQTSVALVLAVLVPVSLLPIRWEARGVLLRRDSIKVRQLFRTTTFAWDAVAFGTAPTGAGRRHPLLLVVADHDRRIPFEGHGAFLRRNDELPAVATQLNRLAAEVRQANQTDQTDQTDRRPKR